MIDFQQVRYTAAELSNHYEICHTDRFYSGEAQGPERKYERGKEGYWFWNLGDNVDDETQRQTGSQQGQTNDVSVDGQPEENNTTSNALSEGDETGFGTGDLIRNRFDVGQGVPLRSLTTEVDPSMPMRT